jgi:hypothetical protein
VSYTTAEGREQLLTSIAEAADRLGVALASLTELYELLDEGSADALEQSLFQPVQMAYGRAQRAHAAFAQRHGLTGREFTSAGAPAPALGVSGFLEGAVAAISQADGLLAELQDSMLPVEVGDPQLRAELEQVRVLLGPLAGRARELRRTLGR